MKRQTHGTTSISKRFSIALAWVMFIVLSVFTSAIILLNASKAESRLTKGLNDTAGLAQLSLGTALWQFNDTYVRDFLDSLFLAPDLVFASVSDDKRIIGQKTAPAFSDKSFDFFRLSPDFLALARPIHYNGREVGSIRLAFSKNRIRQAIYIQAASAFLLMVAVLLAVSLTTGVLSRRYIFSPLARLKSSAETIAGGNLDAPIEQSSADEIGDLSQALDTMRIAVKDSMEKLKQADAVKAARDRLELEIAERRRAESAMREERDRAQNYLDIAGTVIVALGIDGTVSLINKKGCQVLGLPEKAILGQNWVDSFVAEEEQDRIRNVVSGLVRGSAQPLDYVENRIITAAGEKRTLAWHNTVLRDAEGNAVGTLSSGEDITERKKAEQALQESAKKLRDTLDATPFPIALADVDDDVIHFWSESALALFGHTAPTVREWYEIAYPDPEYRGEVLGLWKPCLAEARATGRTVNTGEYRITCKDGSVRVCEIYAKFLSDALIVTFNDVTERKRSEEKERALQLRLNQVQKMESIGRLAGGVAHDFNNMLGVILGYSEMVLDELDPASPLLPVLQEVQAAAQRSAELTKQLLGFARKQTISPKVLDLNETVSGMLRMIRRLIGEDMDLVFTPRAAPASIKMDPSQLDQVLTNLCVNARDAISGVGTVTIETRNATFTEEAPHPLCKPGDYVVLSVADNGAGMDRELQSAIFEPFFTTKKMGSGTGLGLATVYGIVTQNQGFIDVASAPGEGSTFTIFLPCFETLAVKKPLPAGAKISLGHGERVLLVEDEPAILAMGKQMLTRLGYTVLAAASPGEALRRAEELGGEIRLLITDVIMPSMNGRELAERLQSAFPRIRVLYMSGYNADIIAHQGALDDNMLLLPKPFSLAELAEAIRTALGEG
ncbi:MAG: PAS domain S-box protein [Thermodesulfobacteriota bacterium]